MVLNHLNLVVPNVAETANFMELYFNFKIEKLSGNVLAILYGNDGFVLVLSNFPKTTSYEYPSDFHIGFYQDSKQKVIDIFNRLKNDGMPVGEEPKPIRDRFGFYFYMPGKILTEITSPVE